MNVPDRLRLVAQHLRNNCHKCSGARWPMARKVSEADMEDHAMELERIALWLENSGIKEVPERYK
jgi:hypothetical protein